MLDDGKIHATLLRPAGTDMNMPLALALVSFFVVEGMGLRAFGFRYLGKFFRFGNLIRGRIGMGIIDIFVGVLELLSEFIRIISFTFRLFGNMTAGEILLLVSGFLISFVFSVPFYGLELLVGVIQALIFAGLTLVFISVAPDAPTSTKRRTSNREEDAVTIILLAFSIGIIGLVAAGLGLVAAGYARERE